MTFDAFLHQLPDADAAETGEWLESLDALVAAEGTVRARFVIGKLLERARRLQVPVPSLVSTPYINTIPPGEEPWFPGDEEMERRIRRIVRWNAAAMVTRANKRSDGIGGHLSTYASAASLYEVGFNHFFRGKDDGTSGDQIYYQGHAAPGMYSHAYLEGRITEAQLDNFRQETGGNGLSSYPHPRLMPDFWEFPTVSMGLGPLNAIYQARFNRYLYNRGIADTSESRGLVLPRRRRVRRARGAGRALARRARAARQPHLRRQLQPAAARRPGARQREDHPGARGHLPRRGLERHQGDLGARVGRAARARRARRARRPDEPHAGRGVPEVRDRERRVHPRALLRARPAAAQDGRAPLRRRPASPPARRSRLPQALLRVQARARAARRAHGDPRPHGEGLDARIGLRGAQLHAPDQEDRRGGVARVPRSAPPADQRQAARRREASLLPPREGPRRGRVPAERRRALGGLLPRRVVRSKPLELPGREALRGVRRRQRDARGVDHDGVRRHPPQPAARSQGREPHRADHPRRGAHVRHGRAVQRDEDLRAVRPAATSRSTRAWCCRTARRPTGRSSRRASPRPGRWPPSPPPAPRTRRTARR